MILALALAGLAAAAYVLVQERAPVPFQSTYDMKVILTAANGVQPGLGQPVNVAGVKVGTIVGLKLSGDGDAITTLQIDRSKVPHVYANASAALAPITPLNDMELDLDPGRPPAPALAAGATLGVGSTATPIPLSTLLSTLDGDTRDFVTSMLASFSRGTQGRGPDIRRALLALGPTTNQLRQITDALATRRMDLARLVHNLAIVTRSASQDRQLTSLVEAGNATLAALAAQDQPLRQAIAQLPGTLGTARSTLSNVARFAGTLGPTETALLPAAARLPQTLTALGTLSSVGTTAFAKQIRPFVRAAEPLVRQLAPATTALKALAPSMTSVFQVLNYFFNELAYNPGGRNQGYLFWTAWFFHNGDSATSIADAHGSIIRTSVYLSCGQATQTLGTILKLFEIATGVSSLCPGS
jgi:phospholipid/cholesterol/gamma-HCH transport system substrate-binding protein